MAGGTLLGEAQIYSAATCAAERYSPLGGSIRWLHPELGETTQGDCVPLFADRIPSMMRFALLRRAWAEDQHTVARCDRLRAVRDDDAGELQLLDGLVIRKINVYAVTKEPRASN